MSLTGGPVFWMLIVIAIAAVIVFIERFIELRRAQIDYEDFIKGIVNILEAGNADEALSVCEDTPTPVANVVATAIRHRSGSARLLREAVDSQGRAEVGRLDRRLASLAIMGQVSPLLGLLGTLVGFAKAVIAANAAAVVVRADLLNAAMESVMSAVMGIAVAIPLVIMYGMLRVRLDRITLELEAAASRMVGFLASQKEREVTMRAHEHETAKEAAS